MQFQSLHKYWFCTVSLHLRAKGKFCQMSLRSDSAQCRNLSNRIPSAGTQCGANWQLHRKLGEAKQQADGKVRVLGVRDDLGPHVQLVVNIGSIPQQSVHRLGVSILGRHGQSRATILQRKQAANVIHCSWSFPLPFCCCMNRSVQMVTFSSKTSHLVRGSHGPCHRTFVWKSVEAPNSKRSFTTSL